MKNLITAEGEKIINIAGPEMVRLTSDHHIRPQVWAELAGHALNGTRPDTSQREAFTSRFAIDFLEPRQPFEVDHQILNGDYIHTDPHHNGDTVNNHAGWQAIEQAVVAHDITGEQLTMLPGNHSLVSSMPQSSVEQLTNRGILVPSGKAKIVTPDTTLHIRHGHEFDGKSRKHMTWEHSPVIQELLEQLVRSARKVTGVKYFPYGNDITQTMNLILNAPQMIRAEQGLAEGEWAIDGHTHFAGIQPPNGNDPDPEFNLLSKEYLEKVLYDSPIARTALKLAAKLIPNLAGIDQWYVTSHNGKGYANTGFFDPLSKVTSALDVRSNGIDLLLANVNGGYTPGMMRARSHESISKVERHAFKAAPEP
jgi:UDP-2,3-diacylglucosamine pyrophosphatase LpxH